MIPVQLAQSVLLPGGNVLRHRDAEVLADLLLAAGIHVDQVCRGNSSDAARVPLTGHMIAIFHRMRKFEAAP